MTPFRCVLQTAIVFASQNGLKVTVEDAKCVQANAFMQAGLFQEYTLKEEQTTFKVNLTVLLVGHGSDLTAPLRSTEHCC